LDQAIVTHTQDNEIFLQEKAVETTKKEGERRKLKNLVGISPTSKKACHSMSTALFQSAAKIGA
jgi:hypothetical protein